MLLIIILSSARRHDAVFEEKQNVWGSKVFVQLKRNIVIFEQIWMVPLCDWAFHLAFSGLQFKWICINKIRIIMDVPLSPNKKANWRRRNGILSLKTEKNMNEVSSDWHLNIN